MNLPRSPRLSCNYPVAILGDGEADRVGQASRLSPNSLPAVTKGWLSPKAREFGPELISKDVRDRRDACPTASARPNTTTTSGGGA